MLLVPSRFKKMSTEVAVSSWEAKARERQQELWKLFGSTSWESYRTSLPSICNLLLNGWCKCLDDNGLCKSDVEMNLLKKKIGFALFGEPQCEPSISNQFSCYESKQIAEINKVYTKIVGKKQEDNVLMSVIYVILEGRPKKDSEAKDLVFPVFRIPKPRCDKGSEMFWFVDHVGRVYKGWESFIKNNVLPEGRFCYPKDGTYFCNSGRVEFLIGKTPASNLSRKVVNVIDITSSIAGIGAELTLFLLPFASATAAAAAAPACVGGSIVAGTYCLARSAVSQADRGLHGESISITNRESLKNWLGISGSVLGLGSLGATTVLQNMARNGRVVSKWVTGATNGLRYSSLVVSGAGLADGAWSLKEKNDINELTTLECCQFASQCFFFFHAVYNTKSARRLFEEFQNQRLEEHKQHLRSNRHRKMFEGIKRETMKNEDPVIGRAKVIKGINHISDADKFYATMIKSRKKFSEAGTKVRFEGSGIVDSNNGTADLKSLFKCPLPFQNEVPDTPLFDNVKHLPLIQSENQKTYSHTIRNGFTALTSYLNSALQNLTPQNPAAAAELLILLKVFCERLPNGEYVMDILQIVFDLKRCNTAHEYLAVAEKFFSFLQKIFERHMSKIFQSTPTEQDENDEDANDDNHVNDNACISTPPKTCDEDIFRHISLSVFLFGIEFEESQELIYHFPEHRSWGERGELSFEEYLMIGQNVLGIPNINNANIRQDGPSSVYVYFKGTGVVFITSDFTKRIIIIRKAISETVMEVDAT